MKIRRIRRSDQEYPERLRRIGDPPQTLYLLGKLPPNQPAVAVVGARLCDRYGHEQAYEYGRTLARFGITVISGMALGIDAYALEGALDEGGTAFAVLGCGVDICYPRSNRKLYDRLLEKGGILSEVPPGTHPTTFLFPRRNRIISGMSDLVLVIEAKVRSGSLITADHALEQGKPVYALPGRVGDALSDGCNYLIAQGAGCAYAPQAVLREVCAIPRCPRSDPDKGAERAEHALTGNAKIVYSHIGRDPISLEEIRKHTPLSTPETAEALIGLLMAGLIEEPAHHLFVRVIGT